ncbi:MAG: cyclic nucleotide-binding domain-containing protein [Pseudomonadota bacterium]|nr:cyclic nucleotide-binding domain-containing protein [Pseudomonadota bacterium]
MTAQVSDGFERVTYQAGEVIFAEGDVGEQAYIVESGIVEIARDVNGKKMTLGTVEKNGIFGEMALIDEATRIANAIAMNETVCIPIPKVAIQAQLSNADPLLRRLFQVLLANARSLSDHINRVVTDDGD